jgi:putative hemolysin
MHKNNLNPNIFSIVKKNETSEKHTLLSFLSKPLEQVLSLHRCSKIYASLPSEKDPALFLKTVIKALNVSPCLSPEDRANIPGKNPAIIIANHPFGAVEGILLADLMLSVRKDVKILANSTLHRIPQLRNILIPVDPFDTRKAVRANIGPIRKAIQWVQKGGMLIVFPAGEVAHLKLSCREISDPAWNTGVGRIIHKTNAAVLPVFFKGSNSLLFQVVGMIHPRLRTALLPRELLNKQHKIIRLKIGRAIPYRWLKNYETDTELLDYLRWRTYLLGYTFRKNPIPRKPFSRAIPKYMEPVARPQNPDRCAGEIHKLPKGQLLLQNGDYTVWKAKAHQLPHVLLEIGRLREISFRLASEGTGRSSDMDWFDTHYLHIFIWHEIKKQVVGAYRLGQTDKILRQYGRRGLYTTTLFKSSREFFAGSARPWNWAVPLFILIIKNHIPPC